MLLAVMSGFGLVGCGFLVVRAAGAIPGAQARPTTSRKSEVPEVRLFVDYLDARWPEGLQMMPLDRRPAKEIFADLKALPKDKLLGLRTFVLQSRYLRGEALEVLGQLVPDGHREFLLKALATERWSPSAIKYLAALNDPRLVGPILTDAKIDRLEPLIPLARPEDPGFLKELRARANDPTGRAAFAIGCTGIAAEKDIRRCAASGSVVIRHSAIYGLSLSKDKKALPLLLQIANLDDRSESFSVASRFVVEGSSQVPELIQWLSANPGKEKVAGYALARIRSDRGVAAVLAHYQTKPFDNSLAGSSARSSTRAARAFIADKVLHGTKVEKLNALLVAHHLVGYDQPVPGKEHPLLGVLLMASHDAEPEVRLESTGVLANFAYDAGHPEGRKVLRRLVEMLKDPSPRVRSEAVSQASQYPSPEVLVLIKKMATGDQDTAVRDSATRASTSLESRLSHLAGTGHKPVYLNG